LSHVVVILTNGPDASEFDSPCGSALSYSRLLRRIWPICPMVLYLNPTVFSMPISG